MLRIVDDEGREVGRIQCGHGAESDPLRIIDLVHHGGREDAAANDRGDQWFAEVSLRPDAR